VQATAPRLELPGEPAALDALALEHLRTIGLQGDFSLDRLLRQWERAYINAAQQLAQGNLSQAAKLLGVNRTTLYNRIETLARTDS